MQHMSNFPFCRSATARYFIMFEDDIVYFGSIVALRFQWRVFKNLQTNKSLCIIRSKTRKFLVPLVQKERIMIYFRLHCWQQSFLTEQKYGWSILGELVWELRCLLQRMPLASNSRLNMFILKNFEKKVDVQTSRQLLVEYFGSLADLLLAQQSHLGSWETLVR